MGSVTNKSKPPATPTTSTRHRTLSTPGSVTYITGYPQKLYIYQLPASKYWWVRYYTGKSTVRRSTKTSSKRDAITFAKKFFDDITHMQLHGMPVNTPSSFAACASDMLKAEEAKLARGELTKITYDNTNYRMNKMVLPYFRKHEVGSIDYFALEGYLDKLSKQTPVLSLSTISAYMGLVRKVLVYAARRGFIKSLPEFPKVGVQDNARGWFNTKEMRKVWGAAQRYLGKTIEVRKYKDANGNTQTQYIDTTASADEKLGKLMRKVEMTEDIRRLVVFMTNSYIRPTDIKFMQHKHVTVVRGEYKYLRLAIPPTKKHKDPITTMGNAVDVYERLKAYHSAKGMAKDDDYVFLPQYTSRDYALKQLQRQFEILMWDTGLGEGANGEQRTLYSLRHTSIMYRLLFGDGINTLLLARNARTSVEMIDRFYAKPLTGEMNIGMLQSRKRKRRIYDGELEAQQAP